MNEKQTRSTASTVHIPVLLQHIIDSLAIRAGDVIVDGTAGGGGHAEALLEHLGPDGRYVAIDADNGALERVRTRLGGDARVQYAQGNFRRLDTLLHGVGVEHFDKLLLDLGLSSDQLEESEHRGFSYQYEAPLRMTLSDTATEGELTAWHVVNEWSEASLADILFGFGGERHSRKIAAAIVAAREEAPIDTTTALTELIEQTVRSKGRIHCATRTFQAIRMAVNDELGAIEEGLEVARTMLSPKGRIAVITFHSLEDRTVKNIFRDWEKEGYGKRVNKHVLVPDREEVLANRRARSAKLRVFERQDNQ